MKNNSLDHKEFWNAIGKILNCNLVKGYSRDEERVIDFTKCNYLIPTTNVYLTKLQIEQTWRWDGTPNKPVTHLYYELCNGLIFGSVNIGRYANFYGDTNDETKLKGSMVDDLIYSIFHNSKDEIIDHNETTLGEDIMKKEDLLIEKMIREGKSDKAIIKRLTESSRSDVKLKVLDLFKTLVKNGKENYEDPRDEDDIFDSYYEEFYYLGREMKSKFYDLKNIMDNLGVSNPEKFSKNCLDAFDEGLEYQ